MSNLCYDIAEMDGIKAENHNGIAVFNVGVAYRWTELG